MSQVEERGLSIPGRLGERYEILELIGKSEITEVYRVKDRQGHRIVALKILQKSALAEYGLLLNREFFYLSQLSHPNIVQVFDYGISPDGLPFFTMEFVPGVEITRFFQGYTPKLINVLIEILSALDSIHREGLIHCDIKPGNILVYEDNGILRVKLLDLGFVERVSLAQEDKRGTPGYVAPEVLKGVEIDGRADLYSLGLVLYVILTGIGPDKGISLEEWLKRQYHTGFEPIRRFNPAVPEGLESVVLRLMNRERERRPRNAGAVIQDLMVAGLVPDPEPGIVRSAPASADWRTANRRDILAPGFVGRQELLDELKGLFAHASKGKPGVVFITGERGVGKSRLLAEFKFIAQLAGARVLAFEPVALGARSQSLVELLVSTLKTGAEPEQVIDFDLFEQSKFRLFEALVQRLKAVSESHVLTHSLVVLVDDFELFDPLSLEFLRYLTLSLEKERILVVVSGLKEERFLELVSELSNQERCRHFEVGVLTRENVRELVISVVGEIEGIEELVNWLVEFGGGNPLTTMELIYAMVEQGVLCRDGLNWRLSIESLSVFSIPKNVVELVRRRVAALSPEDLVLLEVGALFAGPFTIEFLRAVLNYHDRLLFQAVNRLKAAGLLRPFYQRDNETGQVRPGLVLASKILETVVSERIPPERRRRLHRQIALTMELLSAGERKRRVFDIAHQWIQSGDREQGYRYAVKAGEQARDWLLFDEARLFYESALQLAPDYVTAQERLQLIERVGELREATGRYAEAIDIYRQGLSTVVAYPIPGQDKLIIARFLRRLGLVSLKLGDSREALALFNQALAFTQDADTIESARLLADLGWVHCSAGNLELAEDYLTRAMKKAEKLRRDYPREANRLVGIVLYYFAFLQVVRRDYILALQLAENSIDVFRSIDDQFMISIVSQFLASLWLRRGETGRAKKCFEEAIRTQRQSGDVYYLLNSYHGLGLICYEQGVWEQAEEYFLSALQLAEKMGNSVDAFNLHLLLGNLYFERGDWGRAREHYERCLKIDERYREQIAPESRITLWNNIGHFYSLSGDFSAAAQYLSKAQELVASRRNPELKFFLAINQAKLELSAERYERAKWYLGQAVKALRDCRDFKKAGILWSVIGEYRLATGAQVYFEAQRAVAILENQPESIEYAQALRLLARSLRATAKIEQALKHFQKSIEILRRLGAKYELARTLLASAELFVGEGLPVLSAVRGVAGEQYEWVRANLQEALSIFKLLGLQIEVERTERTIERLEQRYGIIHLKSREREQYLRVFYQLSELMNNGIERDDFLEQVLEMVLSITRAERGIIFLFQRERLLPVAVRGVEEETVKDAETFSHTVLRKVRRRHEPLISTDALIDPRFNTASSVILNKIRSLLCVPLIWEDRVIGSIYLDSRVTTHLFTEEDRNLLQSVGHLISATIERSKVFQRWQEERTLSVDDLPIDPATGLFLGRSRVMREVLSLVDKIAPTDCTVLITGETGTGKGVVARLIHQRSGRKDNKFVPVNCGTLPETLFESELFGHVRGAFTGAVRDKTGIFETANGGTIFLDEITNTTLAIQAKLLQVLEEKIIRRLGDTETRLVDVRLICASNKDLLSEVKAGRFREDLYYRMNVVTITVPPLRERAQDIIPLANYFLRNFASQLNKPIGGFDNEVSEVFKVYSWPGNVRELQNTIERAVIMTQNPVITIEDLGEPFLKLRESIKKPPRNRRSLTREQVIQALAQTNGNITHAANLLSVHRRQIQRLIKRYEIQPRDIETQP